MLEKIVMEIGLNETLKACERVTGVYPTNIGEIKKAMLGFEYSLLLKNLG